MKSWFNKLFLGKNMGARGSKIPPCSPLSFVLKYWDKFGGDPLTKGKMVEYCNTW